ncbi:MAG: hypothetical protein OCC49_19230 [Fibrobacterales bacterium]
MRCLFLLLKPDFSILLNMIKYITLLSVLISMSYALPFFGNESHKKWRSSRTDHFDFHYEAYLVDYAEQAAGIAEEMYDSISIRYPSYDPSHMDFTLNNALYSNGSANFLQSHINIWLTDWGIKLRSTHNWLADVVTHEFAHIISIQSGVKTVPFMYTAHLLSTDYYDNRVQKNFSMVLPNFLQPHWFAEGTAQYESERMGFDSWDSHRDMIMRVASLNKKVLPIEKMNSFTTHGLEVEQGPYTQGFSLVRYIAHRYGDASIPKLWEENGTWYRATFSATLQKVLGVNQEKLYSDWLDFELRRAQLQSDLIGEEVEGEAYTTDRIYYDHPQVTLNGDLYVVAGESETSFRGTLLYVPQDSLKEGVVERDFESVLKDKELLMPVEDPVWSKGFSVYSKDTIDYIAYVSAKNRDRDGVRYFDIRITCQGSQKCEDKGDTEVTWLQNAINPMFATDGSSLLYVARDLASTSFSLKSLKLDDQFRPIDEPRVIFSFQDSSRLEGQIRGGHNLYTPQYSPDGTKIVLGIYNGERRSVIVIDKEGVQIANVNIPALDVRDPLWLNDSTLVVSANTLVGRKESPTIFNLYTYDIHSKKYIKLTNVLGGAFTPTINHKTQDLFYTQYDINGFSLHAMPLSDRMFDVSESLLSELEVSNNEIKKDVIPKSFKSKQFEYSSLPRRTIISPLYFYEESPKNIDASKTERVHKLGLSALINDPLGKNEFMALLFMQVDKFANPISLDYGINPEVNADMMIQWTNRSFPITLDLAAMQSNREYIDTVTVDAGGGFTQFNRSPYAVKQNAFTSSARYSLFKEGDFVQLGSGYSWSTFNFYNDAGGIWEFNNQWVYSLQAGYMASAPSSDAEGLAASGIGLSGGVSYTDSELFRPGGDFSNSFTVSESNVKQQKMSNYQLMETGVNGFISLPNPFLGDSRFVATVSTSALLDWQFKKPDSDTTIGLDNFYKQGVSISGYPYTTEEDLTILGENTLFFSIEHQWALIKNIHKSFWVVHLKDLYVDAFFQTGQAWDGKYYNYLTEGEYRDFYRSWGFAFRFTQKLFYHYPFQLYARYSKALDPLLPDGSVLSTIDIGLASSFQPTRLEFGFHIDIPKDPSVDNSNVHPLRNSRK